MKKKRARKKKLIAKVANFLISFTRFTQMHRNYD